MTHKNQTDLNIKELAQNASACGISYNWICDHSGVPYNTLKRWREEGLAGARSSSLKRLKLVARTLKEFRCIQEKYLGDF